MSGSIRRDTKESHAQCYRYAVGLFQIFVDITRKSSQPRVFGRDHWQLIDLDYSVLVLPNVLVS